MAVISVEKSEENCASLSFSDVLSEMANEQLEQFIGRIFEASLVPIVPCRANPSSVLLEENEKSPEA